jgi:type I restriction enzyme S subunit
MGRQIEAPEGWKISLLDSVTKRGSGHTPDKQHPEYWNQTKRFRSLALPSRPPLFTRQGL